MKFEGPGAADIQAIYDYVYLSISRKSPGDVLYMGHNQYRSLCRLEMSTATMLDFGNGTHFMGFKIIRVIQDNYLQIAKGY